MGLALMAALQLGVPAGMIARRELTLRTGTAYRFRTAPVDPYDAFRGRFVALQIDPANAELEPGQRLARGQRVFARLGSDTNGFAVVNGLSTKASGDGIWVKLHYVSGSTARLRWPMDRYYMNEKDAPAAEAAYRRHSRRGQRDAWVDVRVRRGHAVIEDLHVGGRPIAAFLREEARAKDEQGQAP
jgi:uncharacterized membrane-anchored protein